MSGSRLAFGSVTPSKSKTKNSAQPLGDASQKVSAKAASFGLLQQHATLQLHARHYCTLDMSKNTHAHTLTHTLSHTQIYTYIHQHAYTHSLSHTHIRNKHTTHTHTNVQANKSSSKEPGTDAIKHYWQDRTSATSAGSLMAT